jgi:hypothetical protein
MNSIFDGFSTIFCGIIVKLDRNNKAKAFLIDLFNKVCFKDAFDPKDFLQNEKKLLPMSNCQNHEAN